MDFGLFGSKKDNDEMKDTLDVKKATMNQSLSPPAFDSGDTIAIQTQSQVDTFVNPFSQPMKNSQGNITEEIDLNKEFEDNQMNNSIPMNVRVPQEPIASAVKQMTTSKPIEQPTLNLGSGKNSYTKEEIQEIIDETVEKVIEERWEQLVDKVNKVAAWKEKQDAHINMIKEDIVAMKDGVDKLEKRLINKVESYDKNILDVNSEIKALEKVFQKITPTLVNNVNELTRITQGLKGDKKSSDDNLSEE